MKTVFHYIRPKLPVMSIQLGIKFFGTIIELLLPWMLSQILDVAAPSSNASSIWAWGGWMVLCAAGALAANIVANRMATGISRDITRQLRHDLFARVLTLSCAQEDVFTTPSLITRLTSDTYNTHQMIDRMQRLGVRAPILLLGGILLCFTLEPVLTLVLVAVLPLLALVVFTVSGKGTRLYTHTQSAMDGMLRRAQESMNGMRVIQALSRTDYERDRFGSANDEVMQREQKAGLLMNITNPVMNFLLNAGLTAVIVVGAFRVNSGLTTTGTIIAFLSYFTIILNALMMVTRLFMMYSKGAASAQRIAEVMNAPQDSQCCNTAVSNYGSLQQNAVQPPVESAACPDTCAASTCETALKFEQVSFSYNGRQDTLQDLNFTLKKGQTLGILGPTGSGKSTLLRLILGFYPVSGGQITVFGQDVRQIPPEILYTLFGVVFQNDFLYAGTLGEAIDFGRRLTPEQLERGIRTAQADFIGQRDGGLQGELAARGANLSGGQKQRLLLARALAADPAILLLDDSSSALDYKTDAALRRALARDFCGTTKVIVAQRISSLQHADLILMLEDGRITGQGTHEELLRSCDAYREIAELQMGTDAVSI